MGEATIDIHCWIFGLAFGSIVTLPWGENTMLKLAKPCRRGNFIWQAKKQASSAKMAQN
jgi:hypothetical protein